MYVFFTQSISLSAKLSKYTEVKVKGQSQITYAV